MKDLKKLYNSACKAYNSGVEHYGICLAIVTYCQRKLRREAQFEPYGEFAGSPAVSYHVFSLSGVVSRPIRPDLFIGDPDEFVEAHVGLLKILKAIDHVWSEADYDHAGRVVYTAIMSFACCYDIWQPKSRKTPGTFFEVFMAGLLNAAFPDAVLSKHISLAEILAKEDVNTGTDVQETAKEKKEDEKEKSSSVSTDIVIGVDDRSGGIVIPLKITTRERIVQPFAHQRILDAAFGDGHFRSLIVCISETQLDKGTRTVKQVCVPGTIALFQKYLAPVGGLYYCDMPQRYSKEDVTRIVSVRPIGYLFRDIRTMLGEIKARAKAD